ncbi:hypothetical protein OS493_001951 [Desmophyllum pertusum]|uniref:Ig-like domain-containing protein n=1 Tax=Desmophyllum pertusum TaxID=174260 RepID=A0A9X0CUY5_9CNID|nr:hypothetical protein OS493_001951 [Desmophyllum pertusum]
MQIQEEIECSTSRQSQNHGSYRDRTNGKDKTRLSVGYIADARENHYKVTCPGNRSQTSVDRRKESKTSEFWIIACCPKGKPLTFLNDNAFCCGGRGHCFDASLLDLSWSLRRAAIIVEVELQQLVPKFRTTRLLRVPKERYVEMAFIMRCTALQCCIDDEYLEVRDGHNQSANLLGTFCGRSTSHIIQGVIRSSGRYMWLKFSPDSSRYLYYFYYKARSVTVPPNLNRVAKTQSVLFNHSSSLWCPAQGAPAPYIVWRKNGTEVQNSTSVRYELNITEEKNEKYSCEVETPDGCPDPCQCTVLKENMDALIWIDCNGKKQRSFSCKVPLVTVKLALSNNQLEVLPSGLFNGNFKLMRLDLSYNELLELPLDVFNKTHLLKEIFLNNNNLTNLPSDLLTGLRFLKNLTLDFNKLEKLNSDVFKDVELYDL